MRVQMLSHARRRWVGVALAAATAAAGAGLGTMASAEAAEPVPVGAISGTVTAQVGGAPVKDVTVIGYQLTSEADGPVRTWVPVRFAKTNAAGAYTLYGSPGEYRVQFSACPTQDCAASSYAPEFYNDVTTVDAATTLTITDNADRTGVNASLAPGHLLAGTVTGPQAAAVGDGLVTAYTKTGDTWNATYFSKIESDGTYSFVVPDGSYKVGYAGKGANYAREYYNDSADLAGAQALAVAGAPRTGIDAQLALIKVQPTAKPYISGVPRVGDTLAVTVGSWLPQSDDYQFTSTWFRSGSPDPIGTGDSIVVPAAALGDKITVRVSGTLAGYDANAIVSEPTPTVAPEPTSLASVVPPRVLGTAQVGRTLTVDPGTWEATPNAYGYLWLADGTQIPGATARTFTLTPAQLGKDITVLVTAIAPGYLAGYGQARAASEVKPGTLSVRTAPRIKGKAKVGSRLTVTYAAASPAATVRIQWTVGGKPVAGATRATYKPGKAAKGKKVRAVVTYTAPGYDRRSVGSAAVRVR
ncbi:hypothetical protein [Pimelobacter simplex]|uniref:hypothetical protein n=1 Tax=Nocardioides simplex TaxID=2045 RepID=UPI003AAE7C45